MIGYDWPPRMLMRIACAYTGRSRWYLARKAREGELPIAGRNGRSLVFDRNALDVLLVGETASETPKTKQAAALLRTRQPASNISALDRIAALRRGAL